MQLVEVKKSLAQNGVSLPVTIQITGTLSYCRIARRIEGEELEKRNKERAAKGWTQYNRPYYTLTLDNPTIVNDQKPETNDAKNYLFQKISNKPNTQGVVTPKFFAESKSQFAPNVVYGAAAGEKAGTAISDRDNPLERELANGLNVTIGMKFYKASQGVGIGCGVDYVIVNEPEVRYYESHSALDEALAAQGVIYKGMQNPSQGQTVAPAAQPQNSWNGQAQAQPQPQPQPQQPAQPQNFQQTGSYQPGALGNAAQGQTGGPFTGAMNTPIDDAAQKQTAMPFGNAPSNNLTPGAGVGVQYTPQ